MLTGKYKNLLLGQRERNSVAQKNPSEKMEAEETARDEVAAEKKAEELRPRKPGKKRLSVVLSILVSFLVGMPCSLPFPFDAKN